jgi:thiol-disulfide isomerase/thioredoxin
VLQMKSIFRKPAALAAGFLITILVSFAAPAQTLSDNAVKHASWIESALAERLAVSSLGPRPRACFCDEDCFAALLKTEKKRRLLFPDRVPETFAVSSSTDEIRVIDLEGLKKVLQRDPKDARPLLVNFWATWCDPCREEFPDLVKVDTDYRSKGLNFVAVSLDDISDVKSAVPKFLKDMKAEMPVVLLNVNDPEPAIKAVDATWDGQLPATFLYDKEGKVVFKHFGRIDAVELRNAIDKALGGKQ